MPSSAGRPRPSSAQVVGSGMGLAARRFCWDCREGSDCCEGSGVKESRLLLDLRGWPWSRFGWWHSARCSDSSEASLRAKSGCCAAWCSEWFFDLCLVRASLNQIRTLTRRYAIRAAMSCRGNCLIVFTMWQGENRENVFPPGSWRASAGVAQR